MLKIPIFLLYHPTYLMNAHHLIEQRFNKDEIQYLSDSVALCNTVCVS